MNDQSSNIDSESKPPAVSFLQVNDANDPLDYGFMYKPICNHPFRVCSKYNINFTSCIVDCFDIANMSIELIANECYFVGDNVMSMTNSKKKICYICGLLEMSIQFVESLIGKNYLIA